MISNNIEISTNYTNSYNTTSSIPIKINNNYNNYNNNNNNSNYSSPSTSPKLFGSPSTSPPLQQLSSSSSEINKKKFSIKTILLNRKQPKTPLNQSLEQPIFDNLPFEVIEKIFTYLYEYDIYRICLVCSYWYEISKSNEIWLNIYKKRSFHCQLLKQNVKEIDFKSVLKLKKNIESNWKNGKFKSTVLTGHTESINSILFTGNKILSTSRDQSLKIWDYYTNECIKTFYNKSIINCMEKDCENKRVVCGTLNGFINVYNIETSILEHTEKGHNSFISTLKKSNNLDIYCSGSKDKEIKLWNFYSGLDDKIDEIYDNDDDDIIFNNRNRNNMNSQKTLMIKRLGSHELSVSNIEWCNLNNQHVYSSGGKTVKKWDVESGQLISTYISPSRIINAGCLSVKNGMIACAGEGPIGVFDSRVNDNGNPIKTMSPESQFVYCLQYEPSLNSIVTGSCDNKVKCFRADTGLIEQSFLGHTHPVSWLSYDQNHIISSGIDGNIWVWNYGFQDSSRSLNASISPRKVGSFHKLEGHSSFIRATFCDETKIISGSHDNTIRIWDFTNFKKDNKCNLM